jgi:hypothetical protein
MNAVETPSLRLPSGRGLLLRVLIAAVVATVIVVCVVLPAEYGIDPLKTGAVLHLTEMSKAAEAKPAGKTVLTTGQAAVYTAQPQIYKTDSEDLLLTPGQGVEIKYHMQKGAGMVYAWKANGKVAFEFHGEPDQKPNPDYFESYELDDKIGQDHSYGAFTAPSTGIHGWFWENKGDKDVEIHLTTAGFYDKATMFVDGKPEDMPVADAK